MYARRLAVIGVAGLLSGVVLYGGAQPAASAGSGSSAAPQSARQKIHGTLIAIDAVTANDVWAVGGCYCPPHTFSHWDGKSWTTVDGQFAVTTRDVDALSHKNVWAAGYEGVGHFDGSQWTAALQDQFLALYGISVTRPHDVWVAGKRLSPPFSATVLHWDGTTWSEKDFPYQGADFDSQDISASAPNDVWMVVQSASGGVVHNEHWDGSSWSDISSPDAEFVPRSVVAISPTDAWIVGYRFGAAEVMHWDGDELRVVPLQPPPGTSTLEDVSAASPTDVWAVGYQQNGSIPRALIVHWDGKSWATVPTPFTGQHKTWLMGVTAIDSDDAWAVGSLGKGHGPRLQIAAHWDGSNWTRSL